MREKRCLFLTSSSRETSYPVVNLDIDTLVTGASPPLPIKVSILNSPKKIITADIMI